MENYLGNKEILARNLKMYMDKYGMSSKDIADRIGVEPSAVSYWVNAKYYPRIDKIEKIANIFHVNKSALVEPHPLHPLHDPAGDHLSLSDEERSLITAWNKASDKERDTIYAILKEYGMVRQLTKDTTVSSVS